MVTIEIYNTQKFLNPFFVYWRRIIANFWQYIWFGAIAHSVKLEPKINNARLKEFRLCKIYREPVFDCAFAELLELEQMVFDRLFMHHHIIYVRECIF